MQLLPETGFFMRARSLATKKRVPKKTACDSALFYVTSVHEVALASSVVGRKCSHNVVRR